MTYSYCRLCHGVLLDTILELPHSPRNISRLLKENELANDHSIDIRVVQCKACHFVQLNETLEEDFYDDYLMTVSHSPLMQAYQKSQAESFASRFQMKDKTVIEVGCGDGNYLAHLARAGCRVRGIEPSAKFRNEALRKGFEVFEGYVDSKTPAPLAPYDGFVTREVFEHVPDPNDFLQGIRHSVLPGAPGLVEVPSLEQALQYGRFYVFFSDHVNYFSADTLSVALEKNGFEVLEVTRGMNGEFLEAWVRVKDRPSFSELQKTVIQLSSDLQSLLKEARIKGQRVAIWGAGAKGLTSLAVARIDDVAYVVDSDPHKIGLFTPVTHLRVVSPETLLQEPVDIVILTALAYRDEVIQTLRETLRFSGPIAILGPRLEIL